MQCAVSPILCEATLRSAGRTTARPHTAPCLLNTTIRMMHHPVVHYILTQQRK